MIELINRLAAESGVRDVITRIALIGDVGEPEDYAQIYSTDTVWNWGMTRNEGIDEIIAATGNVGL